MPVLRRQDLLAVGRSKNIVKSHGWTERRCLVHADSMDFPRFLGNWTAEFGQNIIRLILFPDSVPEKSDLLEDFCAIAGIEGLYGRADAKMFQRNSAIGGRAIEIMRQMNMARPGREIEGNNRLLRLFSAILENFYDAPLQKVAPSRGEVAAFLAGYEDSNETTRAIYFPERDRLFSNAISRYPETVVYPDFVPDDVLRILTRLLYEPALLRHLEKARGRKD